MARRTERGATPRRRRSAEREAREPRRLRRTRRKEQPPADRPPIAPVLYGWRHIQAVATALARARAHPLHTALTAGVVGIALALPVAFLLALDNAEEVAGGWAEGAPQASLFLERDIAPDDANDYAARVAGHDAVAGIELITPAEALRELRASTELDAALELLGENPLPPVVVARLDAELPPQAVAEAAGELAADERVTRKRLDQEWVERVHAMTALAERALWLVAGLLAVAVILVIGNTIRLTIESRRHEIEIIKLIGGSDGFVRRPFLYEGVGYGLIGGALAWGLTELGRWGLSGPVDRLAAAYDTTFTLQGLAAAEGALLLAAGALLGVLGAWSAVARHLAAIEPR